MSATRGYHGIEIIAEPADLIADYVPDSSGRYRIFLVKDPEASFDYLVTEINDGIERGGDTFAEIIERSPGWDSYPNRDEWMLTERFGSCPDLDENKGAGVIWIDGAAYTASWADEAVVVTTPEPPPSTYRYNPYEEE
jgi:hypothetical protein